MDELAGSNEFAALYVRVTAVEETAMLDSEVGYVGLATNVLITGLIEDREPKNKEGNGIVECSESDVVFRYFPVNDETAVAPAADNTKLVAEAFEGGSEGGSEGAGLGCTPTLSALIMSAAY